MPLSSRTWLDVPYADKDQAKALGARWDEQQRRWYAPRRGLRGLDRWSARPDLPDLLPGEDRTFGQDLFADPVPSTAWWTHARYCIAEQDWERVRRLVTTRAGRRCEACGRAEDAQRGVRLEAHERWLFDTATRTQRLRRLVCFCSDCHTVTHFGLAQLRGVADHARRHLCEITGMTQAEANLHLEAAFALWRQRSEILWELDLSILTDAGLAVVRPAGSAADRARTAFGRWGEEQRTARATARIRPAPADDAAPRPQPVTMGSRPRPAGLGSRWERWLRTGSGRYEDPAAGLREDASARLREHPALLGCLMLRQSSPPSVWAATQDPAGGHQGHHGHHRERPDLRDSGLRVSCRIPAAQALREDHHFLGT